MRVSVFTALLVALLAVSAFAQSGGHVGIYSDNPGFSDCNLVESIFTPNNVYVVHTTATQADAALLKVQNNWGAIPIGENYGGNLFLGITGPTIYDGGFIIYQGCYPLPHLVAALTLFSTAPTPPCTATLEVVPEPSTASGQIEVTDCGPIILFATGGVLTINGDPTYCPCDIATEETSWSRVKAMYR